MKSVPGEGDREDYVLGIDLGGSTVKAVRVYRDGRRGPVRRIPSQAGEGRERILDQIFSAVDAEIVHQAGRGKLLSMGVGTPGLVDQDGLISGIVVNLANWQNAPLGRVLELRYGVPVKVGNDTNLAALAEHRMGAGSGTRNMIGIFLGTGIGSGIILRGELYSGSYGMEGELGHVVVEPGGLPCSCGQNGCLERYSSARGLVDNTCLMSPDYEGPLGHLSRERPAELSARLIYEYVAEKDPLALAVHRQGCRMLARGIGMIANMFAPDLIVLGGGLMRAGRLILDGVEDHLSGAILPDIRRRMGIREASLGDDAGAVGAAVYALTAV